MKIPFSHKSLTLIGGTLASFGMIASFAQNIVWIYLGILIAGGVAFLPTIFISKNFLIRRKTLPNGLCASGFTLGSTIISFFLRNFTEIYGYHDTFLLIGVLILILFVAIFMYKPVDFVRVFTIKSDESNQEIQEKPSSNSEFKRITQSLRLQSNKMVRISDPSAIMSSGSTVKQYYSVPRPKRSTSTISFLSIKTQHSSVKVLTPRKKLLKKPLYIIILISGVINTISYSSLLIILPQYAKMQSFGESADASLLSIVSIFDLIGMIVASALADLKYFSEPVYCIRGLLLSGVALGLIPWYPHFLVTAFLCAIFSISSGAYNGLTSVIMTDMLSEESLVTYCKFLLINGAFNFVIPPICTVFLDSLSSYISMFEILGVLLIIIACIWLMVLSKGGA